VNVPAAKADAPTPEKTKSSEVIVPDLKVPATAVEPASRVIVTRVLIEPAVTNAAVVLLCTTEVAMKVTGEPVAPVDVAVNVLAPALAPNLHDPTVAMPEALVVAVAPVMEPPPLATAKVTLTPETGLLSASVIMTEGSVETVALAFAL
jgi:hypothetical protein